MTRIWVERPDGSGCELIAEDQRAQFYADWKVLPADRADGLALGMAQREAWDWVKARREQAEAIASTSFGKVQADAASMARINLVALRATLAEQAGVPFAETLTLADNREEELNAAQWVSLFQQIGAHLASSRARGRALRRQIMSAANRRAVEAIGREAGWP